jgi:C-3',4' desaturase CrtD
VFRTAVQERATPAVHSGRADVAILGGGFAGMATALRLQARGLSTVVLEAHGHVGGCAGYFRKRGFSFDVGATTLVDFERGGVGAELLDAAGLSTWDAEALPGYKAWLPDRTVTLHRDPWAWHVERLRAFGDTPAHRVFWALLDRLADAFWAATRAGIRMPVRTPVDLIANLRALRPRDLHLARHLTRTVGETLARYGLHEDRALVALLGMLVEDTVHSTVDAAPLVNAALGVTIRGAGLTRHRGGMHGFWRLLVARYRELGGDLRVGCPVVRVDGAAGDFGVHTGRSVVRAAQVVSALPVELTSTLAAPTGIDRRLRPYLDRDHHDHGGAVVVFLGVPEDEVEGQELTHHQLLHSYHLPLGDGNNMFVSVSAPGDLDSAPPGHRAVMISTHTELSTWETQDEVEYARRKQAVGRNLVALAQRVYPRLGEAVLFRGVGTPRTYQRYTSRPRGAVGGVRQNMHNSNQYAVPHHLGVDGLWLVGDTTWPGLGTVACALGSRLVAEGVESRHRTVARVDAAARR